MKNSILIYRLKLHCIAFVLWLVPVKSYSQQAGILDSTFGNNGMLYCETNFGQNYIPVSIMDAQHRILSLANTINDSGFVIIRHIMDGSLDTTFGINGQEIFNSGTDFLSTSLLLQQDEKILVGGSIQNDFFVARFLADGSLDTAFGNQGQFIFDLGDKEYVVGLAQQIDSKIVFSGITATTAPASHDIVLFRLHSDGIPDSTFGSGGKVITDVAPPGLSGDRSGPIIIQTDGKIVMLNRIGGYLIGQWSVSLLRYESDGMLDTTFANQGVYVDTMSRFNAQTIAVEQDQSIVVAGGNIFDFGGWFYTIKLKKFTSNGTIDSTFAINGTYESQWNLSPGSLSSIIIQSDHKIIVGGTWNDSLLLMRFTMQGDPDSTFAIQGKSVNQFGNYTYYSQNIYLYPNDKITMLCDAVNQVDTNRVIVVRYNNDISNGLLEGTNAGQLHMLVYPNPANNQFTTAWVNNNKKVTITIFDITGKIIYKTISEDSQQMEVNTSDFAEGVYLVQIRTKNFIDTKKVIVAK